MEFLAFCTRLTRNRHNRGRTQLERHRHAFPDSHFWLSLRAASS
jgi:hypothetical protein